ncbi:MAG TPA: sortase, partial [Thiotrichales bacterium]|nr:sortase [Thiotrichales bacterium]
MKHLQKNTPGQLASYLGIAVIALLFSISLWQLAAAGWIQAKAIVAQHLLEDAWDSTGRQNETGVKPWPWADTWPMARLLVPAQGIDQIVLAGDSGSSLAFGPAFSLASARPGETGLTVISGHRDTHFRFIEKLKRNQTLTLQ